MFDSGIPHQAFRALRALPGLAWNPIDGSPTDGFWAVGRYEEVAAVSRDPALFSSARGHIQIYSIDEDALEQRASMIDMDPPEHMRLRRIVSAHFAPRAIQRFGPLVRERAAVLLDAFAKHGRGDWANEIAKPLPIGVICDLLGVPEPDRDLMVELTDALVSGTSGEPVDPNAYGNTTPLRLLPFNHPAAHALRAYAHVLGERRRAAPQDDLVSHLLTATVEGEQLTDDEFSNFFRLLVFAGNETTRTAMSHLAIHLASFPDQFDLLRARRDLIPNAVEEIVRYCSPLYHFRRTATRDTILAGTAIREGEKVVIWYAAANFDERYFPDPERFDITRPLSARNLSYGGGGVHTCLGAGLARLELTQLLNEILDRQLRVELTGPPRFVRSNFANGVESLPARILA
jgi:cholest-4-en-3-one 26-monooxygenase